MKTFSFIIFVVLLVAGQLFFANTVVAEEKSGHAETIERLERLIKAQQQQLEYLQQQVNQLKKTATGAQTEAKEARSVADDTKSRVNQISTAKATVEQAPTEKVVTSDGGERVRLAISGQVNRAVTSSTTVKTPRPTLSTTTTAKAVCALTALPEPPTI